MRRKLQLITLVAVIPMALALFPVTAEAQHGHGGGGGHGTVVVHGGYYGGYRGYYGGSYGAPYWGLGWGWGGYWNPYWYGGYWGAPYYGYPGYYDNSAELRLEVKPKQAQVYVDGYYAGVVDDFDGTWQRLHVRPGNHELTLYLKGYHSVKQTLHLGARQDSRIKYQMLPLAAGEADDPVPQPLPQAAEQEPQGYPQGYPDEPRRPGPPAQPGESRRPASPMPPNEPVAQQGQGFGSLVIRVQPAGADVLVDGERWQGPEGSERLVIQVSEGSHRIEVRKEGYAPFSTTIQVRRGETAPVNVSLPPRGE